MRDFGRSSTVAVMVRLSLAVFVALAGCGSPTYQAWKDEQAQYVSGDVGSSGGSGDAITDGVASESDASGDTGLGATDSADATGGAEATDTADTTGSAGPDGPIGDADKPKIVTVELPDEIHAAGPVPLAVQTEHTETVQIRVDGVDVGDLVPTGEGLFIGELSVRGAIDNGTHEVEIIATLGGYQDRDSASYEVDTPKPGTVAWSFTGPEGSRINRVARTPEGDVIEVGQIEIAGITRPAIGKRSGITGAEMWAEKTIVLDTLAGAVVDVAVLADGRMWVAMNVHEPNKTPRPRIALLDAAGHSLGVEVLGDPGRVVRAIAADADGGCFAVGLGTAEGDWDLAYWRITGKGALTLADMYDYKPVLEPHLFSDLANDVLIDGDRVWIVGASTGKHDKVAIRTRGVLVPMSLDTGEVVTANVIVAPASGTWVHSIFFGATLDGVGRVVVTGYGSDETKHKYRIETSRYAQDGLRTWHQFESEQAAFAYGSDVALDSQGRVMVAGTITQNGVMRGYMVSRSIDSGSFLFDVWFSGTGPSEALGMLVNSHDRIVPAGYVTTNGAMVTRIMLVHG